jgi:hypothetical protein
LAVALKLVPVRVTEVPILPLFGEKLVILGTCAKANPALNTVNTTIVNQNGFCLFIKI